MNTFMTPFIEWLEALSPEVLVPAFVLVRAAAIVVPPVQGWPLDLFAERIWGWKVGFLWSECGVLLGAIISYRIGAAVSEPALEKISLLRKVQRWEASFGKRRWLAWFALRLISNPLFDGLSYVAGILQVPQTLYVTTTVAGSLPSLALFMWGVSRAADVGLGGILLFVCGFLVLSFVLFKRFWRRTEGHDFEQIHP